MFYPLRNCKINYLKKKENKMKQRRVQKAVEHNPL